MGKTVYLRGTGRPKTEEVVTSGKMKAKLLK